MDALLLAIALASSHGATAGDHAGGSGSSKDAPGLQPCVDEPAPPPAPVTAPAPADADGDGKAKSAGHDDAGHPAHEHEARGKSAGSKAAPSKASHARVAPRSTPTPPFPVPRSTPHESSHVQRLHLLERADVPPACGLDPLTLVHTPAIEVDPPPRPIMVHPTSPKVQTDIGVGGQMMLFPSVRVYANTAARVAVDGTDAGQGRRVKITPRGSVGLQARANDRISFGLELSRRGITGGRAQGTEARGMANLRFDFGR